MVVLSIDLVLCTRRGRSLAVLFRRADTDKAVSRERWALPRAPLAEGGSLDEAAADGAVRARGIRPGWLAQIGTFGTPWRRSGEREFSVVYVGVTPETPAGLPEDCRWFAADELPPHTEEQSAIIAAALQTLRERMEHAPIAFRLLSRSFTLGELQEVYELLLGRRLHKASFRRALKAAHLVEPTDTWRSAGRGRPAQLFQFAPRRRPEGQRGVRFERLRG